MKKFDHSDFSCIYKIESSLGAREIDRYKQVIKGKIYLQDYSASKVELVGKLEADKLLFSIGQDNGYSIHDIFDNDQYLMDLAGEIYDFEDDEYFPSIRKLFHDEYISSSSVILIKWIEILPGYRGNDLSKYLIRDFFTNFSEGTDLIVVDTNPIPVSFEDGLTGWKFKMRYTDFEKEKNKMNLIKHFNELGFELADGVSDDYMFLSPITVNAKFNLYKLD